MTELEVPQAAIDALADVHDDNPDFAGARAVRAIAEPVVAAELRRSAKIIEQGEGSHRWMHAAGLRARADGLDGGTS